MNWRERYQQRWIELHAQHEQALAADVRSVLDSQAQRIADQVASGVLLVPLLVHPSDADTLVEAVRASLTRAAAAGAAMERALVNPPKSKAAEPVFGFESGTLLDIPAAVLHAIRNEITETLAQPYWHGINNTTANMLTSAITDGLAAGEGNKQLAKRVSDALGGSVAKERALLIARTEATGAINAGHMSQRSELIRDGLVTGSEWLTMADPLVRETHSALDGVKATDGLFDVGGEAAPYPGWYGLSAAERARCRCTTIASGSFAD